MLLNKGRKIRIIQFSKIPLRIPYSRNPGRNHQIMKTIIIFENKKQKNLVFFKWNHPDPGLDSSCCLVHKDLLPQLGVREKKSCDGTKKRKKGSNFVLFCCPSNSFLPSFFIYAKKTPLSSRPTLGFGLETKKIVFGTKKLENDVKSPADKYVKRLKNPL